MGFFDDNFQRERRVEGVAKVTGKGKYAAEYELPDMAYGVLAGSAIAAGTITSLDTSAARQADGVIAIISYFDKVTVPGFATEEKQRESRISFPIFHSNKIHFAGQPIALVVGQSLEEATYAASLLKPVYTREDHQVDFNTARLDSKMEARGTDRGSLNAWNDSAQVVSEEYLVGAEVHNPMEMHATIAHWTGPDQLRLYDKNQGVNNVQQTIARVFEIPKENVFVQAEFVGGGFGSGLRVWPHVVAAAMAARQLNRPVKVVLTRPQMFSLVGHRPESWQMVKIGADANGVFTGMHHQAKNVTSVYETFNENITGIARKIYTLPNLKTEHGLVPLNLGTPTWMRAPGDVTGDYAIECAIDELCYKLGMDPVEVRMKNISVENDPENGKPWSTNFLDECIQQGARMIDWNKRPRQPRQLKDGDWYRGYGMAIGLWNSGRANTSASLLLHPDGTLTVRCAMTDIGTGTGTGMLNIAHDKTGVEKNKIKVELGNSDLPPAPNQGGSIGFASMGGAVSEAAKQLKIKLRDEASKKQNAFANADPEKIILANGQLQFENHRVSLKDFFTAGSNEPILVEASAGPGEERQKYSFCSSAAHFCVVRVNEKTGKVKVERMVCVADGGKIINPQAAANQITGAMAGGVGMALMEEQHADQNLGRLIGNDLAGYHFAVNADVPQCEYAFIGKPDPNISAVGSKGLGEVGIVGVAPAIANAIYNAIGKRVRHLPITPDKIIA